MIDRLEELAMTLHEEDVFDRLATPWRELPESIQARYRRLASAALSAITPMIREQCAKVADDAPNGAYREQKGQCHEAIAAAIRSMKEQEPR